MKITGFKHWPRLCLLACASLSMASTGCGIMAFGPLAGMTQTSVGGQTMPSPAYLRDDVQFYPAGPEDKLANQRRALEEYRLQREAVENGLGPDGP